MKVTVNHLKYIIHRQQKNSIVGDAAQKVESPISHWHGENIPRMIQSDPNIACMQMETDSSGNFSHFLLTGPFALDEGRIFTSSNFLSAKETFRSPIKTEK